MRYLVVLQLLVSVICFAGPAIAEEAAAPAVERAVQQEKSAVQNVLKAGLMQGYPDGSFRPEGEITRAQLARIIDQTFDLASRQPKFNYQFKMADVPPGYWAHDSINRVLSRDIMQGYREGYFHPNHPVSRAEALAIFAQAYGVYQYDEPEVVSILDGYQDASQIPRWAQKAVATALQHGFVDTPEGGQIRPMDPMTREAMAYTLNEYLKRLYPGK